MAGDSGRSGVGGERADAGPAAGAGVLPAVAGPASGRPADGPRLVAEERLLELSEAMFEGLVIHDRGVILWANRAVAELHGYGVDELIGRPLLDLVSPAFRATVQAVAATGQSVRMVGEGLRRDGTIFPCEVADRAVRFEGRDVRAISVRDLSELRRAQAALQRSEKNLRGIIEGAPDAIMVHRAGTFLYANLAGLALTGYERVDELLGRTVLEFIHPDDRARVAASLRETAQTGAPMPPRAGRLLRRDGSVVDVEVATLSIDFDGQPASLVFARDSTARRQAEAERDQLLAQERTARAEAERVAQRSALLAEASRQLAASFDWRATLAAVARLVAAQVGCLCLIDLRGPNGSLVRVAVAHPDPARAEQVAALARGGLDLEAPEGPPRALRSGHVVRYDDLTPEALSAAPWSPAGTRDPEQLALLRGFDLRSLAAAPLIARGRTLGVLTCATGPDSRPHALEDLALLEDLARRVALAVDNARLHEETAAAVRLRDEFLSVASHELKTPLTSLTLAVQGLERVLRRGRGEPGAELPAALATRALDIAGRQASRLGQLVGALLDVTRIQAGRLGLTLEPTDLAVIVNEVTARMANDLQAAGCRLTVTSPPQVLGQWDRSRLDQVVTNLLSNAIKFGAGGPIDIRLTGDDATARFEIRDRGIGLSGEARERIFRRFERAVSTEHYGGLGLGLYIVSRIVEGHGGTVTVDSAPGAGATFVVTLPRSRPASLVRA